MAVCRFYQSIYLKKTSRYSAASNSLGRVEIWCIAWISLFSVSPSLTRRVQSTDYRGSGGVIMSNGRPILVTGAAGQVGGVGRSVTEMLLDRGLAVRALVRTDDDRASELRRRGADVVVGDLLDLHAIHRAIEGCDRVYFGMSIVSTYLEAAA